MTEQTWQQYASAHDVSMSVRHEVLVGMVGELTDFQAPSDLAARLGEHVSEEDRAFAVDSLVTDVGALDEATDLFLAWRWSQPGGPEQVRAALRDAEQKMVAIEVTVLAFVAAYALYLIATRGKMSEERKTVKKADGTETTSSKVTYHDPSALLSRILDRLRDDPPA